MDIFWECVLTFSPTCLDSPFCISGSIQGARHFGTGCVHLPSDPHVALNISLPHVAINISLPHVALNISLPHIELNISLPHIELNISFPQN